MSEVHTVCESIKAHLPAILNDWCSTAELEPWISVPPEQGASNLYPVAVALVEVATGGDDTAQLRSVLEAARHGEQRRDTGFPNSVLLSATPGRLARHSAKLRGRAGGAIDHFPDRHCAHTRYRGLTPRLPSGLIRGTLRMARTPRALGARLASLPAVALPAIHST